MVMKWHDGPVSEGFAGYDKPNDDPNGVSPDGNNGDTYKHAVPTEITYEQLQVQYKFLSGELTRDEAEKQLDVLATSTIL